MSGGRAVGVRGRGLNCRHETSLERRCPYCGQNHLRDGYCQALDEVNRERYPGIWDGSITVNPSHLRDLEGFLRHVSVNSGSEAVNSSVNKKPVNKCPPGGEVAPVHSSQCSQDMENSSEIRKAYRREWMKKKREQDRGVE